MQIKIILAWGGLGVPFSLRVLLYWCRNFASHQKLKRPARCWRYSLSARPETLSLTMLRPKVQLWNQRFLKEMVNQSIMHFCCLLFRSLFILPSWLQSWQSWATLKTGKPPTPKTAFILGKVVSFRGISSGSSPVSIGTHVRFLLHKIQLRWFWNPFC